MHHSGLPRLPTNMDAICWEKATIAREPSNEHNPYTVAVIENVQEKQQVALDASFAFALRIPGLPSVAIGSTAREKVDSWTLYQHRGRNTTN